MYKQSMVLPIRLSDHQRTVVAYFAMFVSILCVILSCAATTYSYLQHLFIDDISQLVRGYYASDVLLTISIVGNLSGTVFAVGCYVCFRVTALQDRKGYNGWLIAYIVTLIVVNVGLGYAVYECYTGLQTPTVERSLETDLLAAMKNYSYVAADKSRIDRMQVNFRCCGSRDFTDWWNIQWCASWIDPYEISRLRSKSGLYLKDDVPFSCCDSSVIRPCVHQAMRDRKIHARYPVGNSTLYKLGCSVAVNQHVVSVGSWVFYGFVALTGLTFVLLVTCRYLQTSISDALHVGNELLPSRGYLLSFGRRHAPGTRAPPPTPVTQTSSPRSPAKVVRKADTKRRRRRRNTNKSNMQANNSAALTELVEDLLSDNAEQWSVDSDLELIAEQLASLSLIQPTSGEPSDGGTTSDLPPPTIVQHVNVSGSVPGEVSSVHSSPSPNSISGLSHSSSASSLQDNWNSNARTDFNSLRTVRSTRSAAPSSTVSVVADRNNDDPTISRARAGTTKYRDLSGSQPRFTSRSDRRNVVNARRLSRVKECSYRTVDKITEDRKYRRSGSEDTSTNWSSAGGSSTLQHVKSSDRMKTHRVKDHRHIKREHDDVHSKCVSERYHAFGPVLQSLDQLPQASRKKNRRHSSSTGPVGYVCPVIRSLGSPATHSIEGRSSEWSTVSCHTVGKDSLTGSERSSKSVKRRGQENSAAALLALSDYLGTYRSNKCSKVVQKSSALTDYRGSLDARMRQSREMSGRSKTGRTSNNSWSTVSWQTLSRPPSSEFQGEVVVDEERACCSKSEQMCQTNINNNCNSSLDQSTSFHVASSTKVRRRSSQDLQHLDSDEMSLSTRSSWTVGRTFCYSHSNTLAGRSASVKHLTQSKYRKLSNKSTLSASLVHAVIDAIQLHLDASAPNTAPDHTWLGSTTPCYHPGPASSDDNNAASVRER